MSIERDDTRPPLPNDSVTGWSAWKDTSVPLYPWCFEAIHGGQRLFMRVRTEEDACHWAARNLEGMQTRAEMFGA